MMFVPYKDEQANINMIHEVRNSDYSLLRLTPTKIKKNNIFFNNFYFFLLESTIRLIFAK